MKNSKQIAFASLIAVASITTHAQSSHLKTEYIKVSGNCEMCKSHIENAGQKKGAAKVSWSSGSKMAELTYDSSKQTADDILKRIALAGYDNERFLAPVEMYSQLPDCCKYERRFKKDRSEINALKKTPDAQLKDQKSHGLENLFSVYFDLKDAFVKSDEKDVSAKSELLLKQINLVDMTTLKEDQHEVWIKLDKKLEHLVSEILKTDGIEKKRITFSELSRNFYQLAKVSHLNYELFYQHCPMFNNGADWLSKDAQIKNPFYGNQMLTCGKTVETIK